ncbi:caspase family protein [Streptomyces sp. NBC_00249]|uniref:HD domain-containing protein n=1 Tax=Streptomyces sp. NBC_00249 TaxID=2975690 RepID=UPI00225BEB4D|nr:caspase family protein [Streptomyces sp. NBC_00249]MCX5197780.1 caspase family protein [Streptomyces sp. NBC_00249]
MDRTRRALLIGVGTTPGAAGHFPPLEQPVAADLRALASSLRASEYEVEVLENATRGDITSRITAVGQEVPAEGTLLIHFTGHGVRIGDTDYLVPHDALAPAGADGDWRQPHVVESLVTADISRYLANCRAGTVLWTLDACRSPMPGDARVLFGSTILQGPPSGGFAVLAGCAPGQECGHTAEGSFFSLGLAEALRPLTAARTVEDVFAAAAAWTRRAAHVHGVLQQPTDRYGSDREPQTRAAVVCEGRQLLESWRRAVRECPLWDRVPAAEAAEADGFRKAVEQLVDDSAETVHRAQQRMPDPWADDDFPVRLLGKTLPGLLPDAAELSSVEAAVLVAAPFLHEAAWANLLSASSEAVSEGTEGDPGRRYFEQVRAHHAHIARKIDDSGPPGRGFTEDARNVSLWLVHRWITEQFETEERPVPAAYAERFVADLLGAEAGGSARTAEFSAAVQEVAAAVSRSQSPDEAPAQVVRVRPGRETRTVRVRPLSALVHLAAALAFDVRGLPDVLGEHLAVPDGVLPQDVVAVLHDVEWYPQDKVLHLDAVCPHPAVHAALAGAVERADELAGELVKASWPPAEAGLMAGLPSRVTDHRLRPLETGGRRAYDVPLLRFQLAQTEVRELLMGEQLYDGRRELALRELYQNAMDACRYRAMRWRYLQGKGHEPQDWKGRISFVQGEDERGAYVECRDTGVGMGVDQLKNTFTRAGRRFEHSRSFRREQDAWLRQDPSLRLYPNSRFGIGVFSYFMLAEEMTIVTRPVGPDGAVAPKALLVHISSSGSLFRIQEFEGPGDSMPEGGTRVRLHLRSEPAAMTLSCVKALRSMVLISEFAMEARDASGGSHSWAPGALNGWAGAVEAVPDTLWWVRGEGAVVCDGVATDVKPFGYVLNLKGPHAGKLSVNRTALQRYDQVWEADTWAAGASAVVSWPGLNMTWLWEMEERNLRCARVLWRALRGRGLSVSVLPVGPAIELDRFGWFSLDARARHHQMEDGPITRRIAWRQGTVAGLPGPLPSSPPVTLSGHPVPGPGWGAVSEADCQDWRQLLALAYSQGRTVAEILRIVRALRITDTRLAPPPSATAVLDWTPDWIDHAAAAGLLSTDDEKYSLEQLQDSGSYQHPPADPGGLVRASFRGLISLGELAERCARYTGLMPMSPPQVPEHHRDHICSQADLSVLYIQVGVGPWRPARRPWDVIELARSTGREPLEISEHIGRFSWLGWPAHDPDAVRGWVMMPDDERSLLIDFLDTRSCDGQTLPWSATLACAGDNAVSLYEAQERLASWAARLGLAYQRRYTDGSSAGRIVPGKATATVVRSAHRRGLRLEQGVNVGELALCRSREIPMAQLPGVMRELRQAGVEVEPGDRLLEAWDEMPPNHRYYFSGRKPVGMLVPSPALPTPDILLSAAEELRESLGQAWRTVRRLAKPLGLRVPPLPAELADTVPARDEASALLDFGGYATVMGMRNVRPRWTVLTASRLIRFAQNASVSPAEAYRCLAPYRAIGALVPELSEPELAAFPDAVPDPHDLLALSGEYRVSEPDAPLGPLDVVSIAARLGEPAGATWRRMVPYLPLEAAPAAVTSVPEVLPLWQDLILLSVHGDGRLPALHGAVSTAHLAFSARAVGEDEAWVRERLELYAEMFDLSLPHPVQEIPR